MNKLLFLIVFITVVLSIKAQTIITIDVKPNKLYQELKKNIDPCSDEKVNIKITGSFKKYEFEYLKEYKIRSLDLSDALIYSIPTIAFAGLNDLESIKIPSTITTIGEAAFALCENLKEVYIDENIKSIEGGAFNQCNANVVVSNDNIEYSSRDGILFNKDQTVLISCPTSKSGEYIIPNTVIQIMPFAFRNCDKLTSVVIASSVNRIGQLAFFQMDNLVSVTIPSSVTTIDVTAFGYCPKLKNIQIPQEIKKIEDAIFSQCGDLNSILISKEVESIGRCAFNGCFGGVKVDPENKIYYSENGILFNKNKTELIQCPTSLKGEYEIPPSVIKVSGGAFSRCSELNSITLNNNINTIESGLFFGCKKLKKLNIPLTVKRIGSQSFQLCESLDTIFIPASVEIIENYAFAECNCFFIVDENNKYYSSEDGALFNKNKTLLIKAPKEIGDDFIIPNSVSMIENQAFNGCDISSIIIPENVIIIGEYSLGRFIWGGIFNGCKNLQSVKLPSKIKFIAPEFFKGCTKLISINFPTKVEKIGNFAFDSCISLTSMILPNTVSVIGDYAFRNCTNLDSIIIDGEIEIGNSAFYGCKNLKKIYNTNKDPGGVLSQIFNGIDKCTCTLFVPIGSKKKYGKTDGWEEFKNIVEYDFRNLKL
jgi:Leucine-rich repeat (LRR) protein